MAMVLAAHATVSWQTARCDQRMSDHGHTVRVIPAIATIFLQKAEHALKRMQPANAILLDLNLGGP